jgi:hypothetical protein
MSIERSRSALYPDGASHPSDPIVPSLSSPKIYIYIPIPIDTSHSSYLLPLLFLLPRTQCRPPRLSSTPFVVTFPLVATVAQSLPRQHPPRPARQQSRPRPPPSGHRITPSAKRSKRPSIISCTSSISPIITMFMGKSMNTMATSMVCLPVCISISSWHDLESLPRRTPNTRHNRKEVVVCQTRLTQDKLALWKATELAREENPGVVHRGPNAPVQLGALSGFLFVL